MVGYNVVPDSLQHAGDAFAAQGTQVTKALDDFVAAAQLPDSAFGSLPNSWELANQYHDFFAQVASDLAALRTSFVESGGRLHTTAENYRTAEASNTLPRRRRA